MVGEWNGLQGGDAINFGAFGGVGFEAFGELEGRVQGGPRGESRLQQGGR